MNNIMLISNDPELLKNLGCGTGSPKNIESEKTYRKINGPYSDTQEMKATFQNQDHETSDNLPGIIAIIDDGTVVRFANFERDIRAWNRDVKPVYGVKLKFAEKNDEVGSDLILIAHNRKGLSNIYRIITNAYSYKEGYKLWPAASHSALDDYRKGVKVVDTDGTLEEICENTEKFSLRPTGLNFYELPNAYEVMESLVYENAYGEYGDPLPEIIDERIEYELREIVMPFEITDDEWLALGGKVSNESASRYMAMSKIARILKENGYQTMMRSLATNSIVAYFLGISGVNPLPAHRICPKCHKFELLENVSDGFDVSDEICPVCGTKLKADGHNLYPGMNTYASLRDQQFEFNVSVAAERVIAEYLAEKCNNAYLTSFDDDGKSSSARIIFIPEGFDIYDFTPLCYFSEADAKSAHMPYTQVKKYDLPNEIFVMTVYFSERMEMLNDLAKMTGVSQEEIPLNDPHVYETMLSNGFTPGEMVRDGVFYYYDDGLRTLGGLNPSKFSESLRREAISHSTGAWENNFEKLVADGVVTDISQIVGSRDDVKDLMIRWGADKVDAWSFSEKVRKGKIFKDGYRTGSDGEREKYEHSISEYAPGCEAPEWFLDACDKTRYLFPRGYCVSLLSEHLRFAWYNLNYPVEYAAVSLTLYWNWYKESELLMDKESLEFEIGNLEENILEINKLRNSYEGSMKGREFMDWPENFSDEELYNELIDTKNILKKMKMVSGLRKAGIELLPADKEKSDQYRYIVEDGKIRIPLHAKELDEA